jgi:hypothetical protein
MHRSSFPVGTLACVFAALAGCHSYQVRSYDLSVRNASREPVTIWLTKDGPPYEDGWWSPEDLATLSPKENPSREVGGVIIEPGKTATAINRRGRFEPQTSAVLRVYRTANGFNDLLSISHGSPSRDDVKLRPGRNELEVDETTVRRLDDDNNNAGR